MTAKVARAAGLEVISRGGSSGRGPDPIVLVAPDKFKGSLAAVDVATAVADGLRAARPDIVVVNLPVADGGDGTVDAVVAAGFDRVPVRVTGPTGEQLDSAYALRDGLAVVELAAASGLVLLPEGRFAPLTATSWGTGDLVAAALDAGCREVIIGVGGSACTDGGAGMLQALGARLLDADGQELGPGGAELARLVHLDLSRLHPRLATVPMVLATDVDSPLLGPLGAAAVYGPQKGASTPDIAVLDAALSRWAHIVDADGADAPGAGADAPGAPGAGADAPGAGADAPGAGAGAPGAGAGAPGAGADAPGAGAGAPGAGAAGGVGYAALSVLRARRRPGIDVVLELVGFYGQLARAVLVVTGEGSLDLQTLNGKAPAGVAAAAAAAGVPAVAVCGRCELDASTLRSAGLVGAYALVDIESDVTRCLLDPVPLLTRLAGRIAADHL